MEEMRKVAQTAYTNFSVEEKRDLESLFKRMDTDGDGKISPAEFKAHFNQYTRSFFDRLDQNGDGFLQFEELLTLSYIEASGRPFCNGCGNFIAGLFFTCTHCRLTNKKVGNCYNLCVPCYQGREFEKHEHAEFDDNYTLLVKMQKMLSSASETTPPQAPQSRRARLKEKIKKTFEIIAQIVDLAAEVDKLSSKFRDRNK